MKCGCRLIKWHFNFAVEAIVGHKMPVVSFSPQTSREAGLHRVSAEEDGRHAGGCGRRGREDSPESRLHAQPPGLQRWRWDPRPEDGVFIVISACNRLFNNNNCEFNTVAFWTVEDVYLCSGKLGLAFKNGIFYPVCMYIIEIIPKNRTAYNNPLDHFCVF